MIITNKKLPIFFTAKRSNHLLSKEIIDECLEKGMTKKEIRDEFNITEDALKYSFSKARKEKKDIISKNFKKLCEQGTKTNKQIADELNISVPLVEKLRRDTKLYSSDVREKRILEMFKQNIPIEEIRKQFNFKYKVAVENALIKQGVKINQIRLQKRYLRFLEIMELKNKGYTNQKIGEIFGVSAGTIYRYLKNNKKILQTFSPDKQLTLGISIKELKMYQRYNRLVQVIEGRKNGMTMKEIAKKLNISFPVLYKDFHLRKEIMQAFEKVSSVLK